MAKVEGSPLAVDESAGIVFKVATTKEREHWSVSQSIERESLGNLLVHNGSIMGL